MNKQLREYYKQIDKALCCPKPLRDGFLRDTKRMADDFMSNSPDATFDELKRFLGEPVEVAVTFMASVQPEVIAAYRKRKLYLKRAGIAVITVMLVGAIALCIYLDRAGKDAVITKESTIIIYETAEG